MCCGFNPTANLPIVIFSSKLFLLKFTQTEEQLMWYTLSSIAVTLGTFSPHMAHRP